MKFTVNKEVFLLPLSLANNIVQKKQTLAILSNLLLEVKDQQLKMISTDMELEFEAIIDVSNAEEGQIAVPARKLFDIIRTHPDEAELNLVLKDERILVKSKSRRFVLNTMSHEEFPSIRGGEFDTQLVLKSEQLKKILEATSFSIAQQDVRYYLNGLYFDTNYGNIRVVATDGHRLALAETEDIDISGDSRSVIIPRKCVYELNRLLTSCDDDVVISLNSEFIEFTIGNNRLISRLIDGVFPDYRTVIPEGGEQILMIDRIQLRDAINRVSVLTNENYKSVEFNISKDCVKLKTHNTDKDEAEEELLAEFIGSEDLLTLAFNCSYIIDVLNTLKTDTVQITFKDSNSGCLIEGHLSKDNNQYVVMPMRL